MSIQIKKATSDFKFGKLIGEGSFSNVFLAKEIATNLEFAIKVVEKEKIIRERKQKYIQREKEVLLKLNHPFFIRLYFTFQDDYRLYFGLSYARNGELLDLLKRLKQFDEKSCCFYSAELVIALEYLHSLNIIHRDLKPENILLDEEMHIKVTDFGSAKILDTVIFSNEENCTKNELRRSNSFVGTAQYVSPEILNNGSPTFSSDLWALGCIIYQMRAGNFPFAGIHEYDIFQKILKLDYELPINFSKESKDLIKKLLVINPNKRIGAHENGGYIKLKNHEFFNSTNWDGLDKQTPPLLFLNWKNNASNDIWSNCKPGLNENQLSLLLSEDLSINDVEPIDNNIIKSPSNSLNRLSSNQTAQTILNWPCSEEDRMMRLNEQSRNNEFHRFVNNNLILKQGYLEKKKGVFARKRMFLLTEGPHLYYIDTVNMILKGEVPLSINLKTEAKNFKVFYINTPNRVYYLEDLEGNALKWCDQIKEVIQHYFLN